MTDWELTATEILTSRAIKQIRNASDNLHGADQQTPGSGARPPISTLLLVLANSIEFHGARNRSQVEGALAKYFDELA